MLLEDTVPAAAATGSPEATADPVEAIRYCAAAVADQAGASRTAVAEANRSEAARVARRYAAAEATRGLAEAAAAMRAARVSMPAVATAASIVVDRRTKRDRRIDPWAMLSTAVSTDRPAAARRCWVVRCRLCS
jgi:hypothetical protein